MGTHPIFESDFDCLTEMSGKLYTYPDNFRADKIRAVANISGYKLDVASEYQHGVTNKTPEFQAKFFGKVPAFESGDVALCDDTAIAHFVGNAQTRGGERSADVLCWAGFAENTLLPSVAQWVWPALSIVQPNKAHMNDAKANLKAAFGFINDVLSKQTFLVGERITYADISCCLTLKSAFENVLTANSDLDSHMLPDGSTLSSTSQESNQSLVTSLSAKKKPNSTPRNITKWLESHKRKRQRKNQRNKSQRRKRRLKPNQQLPPSQKSQRKNHLTHGQIVINSPWIWTHGSDSTPTMMKTNQSNISGLLLPQKSRPTTPCGRVPTNTLTNLLCPSWLPILSEVCSNVLKSSASTPFPPLLSVARPMGLATDNNGG